jgi:hypothetical protein
MKYALAIATAVTLGLACTEAEAPKRYYQGKIQSMSVVEDVFENGQTTYLHLDDGDPSSACDPVVTVTDATDISFMETDPAIRATQADFKIGKVVLVSPPSDPRDVCPMQINATFVRIMQPAP